MNDHARLLGAALLVAGAIVMVLLASSACEPKTILLIPLASMLGGSYLAGRAGA